MVGSPFLCDVMLGEAYHIAVGKVKLTSRAGAYNENTNQGNTDTGWRSINLFFFRMGAVGPDIKEYLFYRSQ
jgi:hypothetical protein